MRLDLFGNGMVFDPGDGWRTLAIRLPPCVAGWGQLVVIRGESWACP